MQTTYKVSYADGGYLIVEGGNATVLGKQAHDDYFSYLRDKKGRSLMEYLIELHNEDLPEEKGPDLSTLCNLYPEYDID